MDIVTSFTNDQLVAYQSGEREDDGECDASGSEIQYQYYRRPSLFADFLSANFHYIHYSKLVQIDNFLVKNGLYICEFRIRGPK